MVVSAEGSSDWWLDRRAAFRGADSLTRVASTSRYSSSSLCLYAIRVIDFPPIEHEKPMLNGMDFPFPQVTLQKKR
jgi:hypothetical protein